MPDSIDWPIPAKSSRPRHRGLVLLLIAIAIVVFGSRTSLSYWVDLLWFRSLGYSDVFLKSRGLAWGIFAPFGIVTFAYLLGAFSAFKRAHLADLPNHHTIIINGNPVSLPVAPVLRAAALGGSFLIALATAATMQAQ